MLQRIMKKTTDKQAWIAYYRVSTKRQSLGLDAQRARVYASAKECGATIIAEYQEKESGKECDRPQLNKALIEARRNGATIVVAKHDRLSRDLAFAAELVFKSGVSFNILNIPLEAMHDPLLFGVYYGMAMKEANMISLRTKEALQAKKAKGKKLGSPNAVKIQEIKEAITAQVKAEHPSITDKELQKEVNKRCKANETYLQLKQSCVPQSKIDAATAARKKKAFDNENNIISADAIRRYLATTTDKKQRTLRKIADYLNEHNITTSRGVYHTSTSVLLICNRYGIERNIG